MARGSEGWAWGCDGQRTCKGIALDLMAADSGLEELGHRAGRRFDA